MAEVSVGSLFESSKYWSNLLQAKVNVFFNIQEIDEDHVKDLSIQKKLQIDLDSPTPTHLISQNNVNKCSLIFISDCVVLSWGSPSCHVVTSSCPPRPYLWPLECRNEQETASHCPHAWTKSKMISC